MPKKKPTSSSYVAKIRLRGVKQNNLKNLNVDFNIGEITVVTGPSGSGKSSLVFDTLYAEGQRRYVETFSAYARQFLDRMDKPLVDKIEGVPPAIAIAQTNPVRTSRSSVGTMTELNDHLKLLFARAAKLFDAKTALLVQQDNPESVWQQLQHRLSDTNLRLIITFAVKVKDRQQVEHTQQMLTAAGYSRIHAQRLAKDKAILLDVIVDRVKWPTTDKARVISALEQAFQHGNSELTIYALDATDKTSSWSFSRQLYCPPSATHYQAPTPSLFSFNSAQGACASCRGFGRVIGVDYGLVIPNAKLTLAQGAIKPIQTPAWQEQQDDLIRFAKRAKIPLNKAWQKLTDQQQAWVLYGDPNWSGNWRQQWYGISRFFEYLESKAYKMHIRVLLSKYRSYTECPSCKGARLTTQALLWRIGSHANAQQVLPAEQRFLPVDCAWSAEQLASLPGLCLHDLMLLPLSKVQQFFANLELDLECHELQAIDLILAEIRHRLTYLCDVGIGYLTLDRQSRTLSGGEVQRINLTTALGTSLVNTLFVLDEPSIGLHPHDMHAVIRAMQGLKKAGNTLVVVEHDPATMLQADRILDMGPAPGAQGGEIVFAGTARQIMQSNCLTGQYLSGKRPMYQRRKLRVTQASSKLSLLGVTQHNLKNINVDFPLNRLVCLTGVSGSGKSTLIQQVLVPALLRHFGQATEAPGSFQQLVGAENLAGVIFIDQNPIGKTTRSNPVSYVNAWSEIRSLLAKTEQAKQRGYSAAKFSFNSGDGRCPECSGSGFEHIEMQFLSDVYLQCPECLGQRYRPEILEVELTRQNQSLNVAQILNLTVVQAKAFFRTDLAVIANLQPLLAVGLGYLKLGQPVPTLSGGEAQRLKLAGYLIEANQTRSNSRQKLAAKSKLFVFDEPTTGLHFDDITKLMQAFDKLITAGHSLIVVEHNLEIIQAADWIIDLGPAGGEEGGYLQAQGSPANLLKQTNSFTAQALRAYQQGFSAQQAVAEADACYQLSNLPVVATPDIQIINATEHNLQHLSVNIPRGKFNVITGVSGSGKSTLAFDILFNEGQRRYLESLNAYARSIVQPAGRPEVDAVYGIAPTVAIEQRLSRGGHKSTVGTITEIWHFLRLLYVKLGVQHCIHDGAIVQPQTVEQIFSQIVKGFNGKKIAVLSPIVRGRKGSYQELFIKARQSGFDYLRVDDQLLPTNQPLRLDRYKEHNIELVVAQLRVDKNQPAQLNQALVLSLEKGHGVMQLLELQSNKIINFSTKRSCPQCNTSYAELDPRLFSYNSKHGWCPSCIGTGLQVNQQQRQLLDETQLENSTGREQKFSEVELTDVTNEVCSVCAGARLNATARAVWFQQRSINMLAALSVEQLASWLQGLKLTPREKTIAQPILTEIRNRLDFLQHVGLSYLSIDRGAPTLSGGEAQRIRLAAQLGSNLQGVCYILDEPTIGLHPRDNALLLKTLKQLSKNNNTLVVVEHDEDTIRHAEHLIDIGPGAGRNGGKLVAQGSLKQICQAKASLTGNFLRQPIQHPLQPRRPVMKRRPKQQPVGWFTIKSACLHNLANITLAIPSQRLVVITGVSGSGKSTLVREVLLPNLKAALTRTQPPKVTWHGCKEITGWQQFERILEVDQTPIGKTSRSCPATYVGFWDNIRQLMAQTVEAQMRGYSASRFSFNVAQGRCDSCQGNGVRTIEMNFLPDVKILCETCQGSRFNQETLAVTWRGRNIGQILKMQIDEAVDFFATMPAISTPLQLLQDVGLGYLTLGQPSPTLSGGEAQRIKLVAELSKVANINKINKPTLYLLDEPTVGLHLADVKKLLLVLHRLVDAGHSLVVVEHDLELIAEADWIIDLGPQGGAAGGKILAQATPEQLVAKYGVRSYTAQALKPILQRSE